MIAKGQRKSLMLRRAGRVTMVKAMSLEVFHPTMVHSPSPSCTSTAICTRKIFSVAYVPAELCPQWQGGSGAKEYFLYGGIGK